MPDAETELNYGTDYVVTEGAVIRVGGTSVRLEVDDHGAVLVDVFLPGHEDGQPIGRLKVGLAEVVNARMVQELAERNAGPGPRP